MKVFDEFKKFVSRGNVLDMAVGVIMGSAFTKIVNSLVQNIITPIISIVTGRVDVSALQIVINESLTIPYGLFLQSIIDFLLIAVSVFVMVKFINKAKDGFIKKEAEKKPEKPTKDQELLIEIRDLLKERSSSVSNESENQ